MTRTALVIDPSPPAGDAPRHLGLRLHGPAALVRSLTGHLPPAR